MTSTIDRTIASYPQTAAEVEPLSPALIAQQIERAVRDRYSFKFLTKDSIVADLTFHAIRESIAEGRSIGRHSIVSRYSATWAAEYVGADKLLTYTRNPVKSRGERGRQRITPREEVEQFRRAILRVYDEAYTAAIKSESPAGPTPTPEPTPEPVKVKTPADAFTQWRDFNLTVRRFVEDRKRQGQQFLDGWSMRPMLDGGRILKCFPQDERNEIVNALKDAVTMDFPQDARETLGVTDWDFTGYGVMRYLLKVVGAAVPLQLVGPPGTGKSTICEKLADELGLDFASTPCSPGITPGYFLGKPTSDRVIKAHFEKIMEGGGVNLLDEIDAAEPGTLIIINGAIAASRYFNPNTESEVRRHMHTVLISAGNTLGQGATKEYGARERQDFAALDRWRAGRIRYLLDEKLESQLFDSIVDSFEPVDFTAAS